MSLFSFFSRKNAPKPKPEWSPFSDNDSFERFVKIVESNLQIYDYQSDIDKGL